MTLAVPTLCVITGHAHSVGLLLALAHDFRLMRSEGATVAVPDLQFGGVITPAFGTMLRNLLPPESARLLMFGES